MEKQIVSGYGHISNIGLSAKEALERLQSLNEKDILKLLPTHLDEDLLPKEIPLTLKETKSVDAKYFYNKNSELLIGAAKEAIDQAGLTVDDLRSKRVGVCIGTTSGSNISVPSFADEYYGGLSPHPRPFIDYYFNNPAMLLREVFKMKGPVRVLNNACTSGTDAIGVGKEWLENEVCDIAIVGGVDSILKNVYFGFRSLKLFSSTHIRPFSKERDGLVLGEGAGVLVLENLKSVYKRNKEPLCEVLSYGMGSDAYHPTSPHPDAIGLDRAVTVALSKAKLNVSEVDLINAHATGTENNDETEGRFLKNKFLETPIFATKSLTGHTLGAAGALEAIYGIMAMNSNFIPGSIGFESVDEKIGLKLNRETISQKSSNFVSTSLGFGGANSALILGHKNGI